MSSLARAFGALALIAAAGASRPASSPFSSGGSLDLLVAATTDVHGRLRGWNYYANAPDPAHGLTRAATIVDSLRAAAPGRVLLVDAGDLLQGNPLAYVAMRVGHFPVHPVIAAMNAMHYDAAAVGNHEFNYGLPALHRAVAEAAFPFLAANAYTVSGARAVPAWRTVRRAGATIAIVGATTPGSMLWDEGNLRGRLVLRDIVPAVRAAVDSVRAAGADVVIVLLHSGLDEPSSYDTVATGVPSENVAARVAREVPGIDLVVYGHSHKEMADTVIGTTRLMQPKNWAASVGVAHLHLTRSGRHWRVTSSDARLVRTAGHAEAPAVLAATRAVHAATMAYVTAPVGSTTVAWRADSARVVDTPLIDLVLDVERRTAHADLASTAAFSLDAALDSGPVTVAELARLYPYENTLQAVRVSGRQLREYLEYSARYFGTYGTAQPVVDPRIPGYNFDIVSGAAYTIDLSRPIGARITRLEVHGRPVADTDTFTLALNNYRRAGGGGYAMLRGAPVVYSGQTEIRQLLIDEVRRRKRIAPGDYFTRNWSIEPAGAVASAYAAMHRAAGVGRASAPATGSAGSAVRAQPVALRTPLRRGAAASTSRPATARARAARASGAPPPRLRIIATNDFHGALEPRRDSAGVRRGGAVALASAIDEARRGCAAPCVTLLVDAGDLFQGSAASNLAFGAPVIDLYNALGYAASAVGNHEFDWGLDTLRARMQGAHFPMLAANVRYTDGRDVDWIPDDTLLVRGPLRIGIIGIIGPETYTSIMARNVARLRFDDPVPIVDSLAADLRARGAQAVIVLAHSGAFCRENGTQACRGAIIDFAEHLRTPVDAVVSGHTHSLVDVVVRGMPIVQARTAGEAVAIIDLEPRPSESGCTTPNCAAANPGQEHAAGTDSVLDERVERVTADSLAPIPAIASLVRSAEARVAPLVSRRVATLAAPMPRSGDQYALGNLIADAQRWAARGDIAFTNNGGIRTGLRAGPVTYGDLFEVQPFGNPVRRLTVPGAALRAYLEQLLAHGAPRVHVSGAVITYDSTAAPLARVREVRFDDGRELRDAGSYTVVLNEFMATGRDAADLAASATTNEVASASDLDVLVGYLSSRPQPVAPPTGDRFIDHHP